MITRTVEEVEVEDLVDSLMEVKMMIRKTRMKLVVVAVRTREEIIPITTIEEEEEGKDLEEEASVENVSIVEKKGIGHMSARSAKEGMIEEMKVKPE